MDPDLAWLHWYAGIGAVMMIAGMAYHMKYQECSRPPIYHLFESLVLWLLWPVILVMGIMYGIARVREHDHDDE